MPCCGARKGRVVKATPEQLAAATGTKTTQFVISPAKNWLPFPTTQKPPGGWDAFGFRVNGPEELAQRLAQRRLLEQKFNGLRAVYREIKDEYCSRPGSPCGKLYKS